MPFQRIRTTRQTIETRRERARRHERRRRLRRDDVPTGTLVTRGTVLGTLVTAYLRRE